MNAETFKNGEDTLTQLRKQIFRLAYRIADASTREEEQILIHELRKTCADRERLELCMRDFHAQEKIRIAAENRQASCEASQAKAKKLRLEALKTQGETREIVQEGVRMGMITPLCETPQQKEVNRQRRSNRGVIRIESGDGK